MIGFAKAGGAGMGAAPGIAAPPAAVDLRLDGNQGRPPGTEFWRQVASLPVELLRAHPSGDALAAKCPLGVVTGCQRRLAESVLQRHGLRPHVRVLVCAEDAPSKPDPAPVRLCQQQLGKRRAWLLGDNQGDVLSARGAGVVPLAVRPHGIGARAACGGVAGGRRRAAGRGCGGDGGVAALAARCVPSAAPLQAAGQARSSSLPRARAASVMVVRNCNHGGGSNVPMSGNARCRALP